MKCHTVSLLLLLSMATMIYFAMVARSLLLYRLFVMAFVHANIIYNYVKLIYGASPPPPLLSQWGHATVISVISLAVLQEITFYLNHVFQVHYFLKNNKQCVFETRVCLLSYRSRKLSALRFSQFTEPCVGRVRHELIMLSRSSGHAAAVVPTSQNQKSQ